MNDQVLANWERKSASHKSRISPFVDGDYVDSHSDKPFRKHNPAHGGPLHEFAEGSASDADRAVASARRAFDDRRWLGLPPAKRKAILHAFANLVEANQHELAFLDALEVGKPISDATNIDIPLALGVLRFCAESIDKLFGQTLQVGDDTLAAVVLAPRGVVAGSIGWNFPTVLAAQKIGPALAAGNCLVLKPSELSSLSALRMAELAIEAGIPAGVFNVIPGIGATVGNALALHHDVDMITFTGSSATGKRIMQSAGASNMKRLLLECGGKSANIVFDDFEDLDAVAQGVIGRMFWNQGQVCTAGTRLIVQDTVKDQLLDSIVKNLDQLRPGPPLNPETNFGPLVSEQQLGKVIHYIEQGTAEGAQLRCGGERILTESGGYFVAPTIFDEVKETMSIAREEIFGPVLSVLSFDNTAEAMRLANATDYGLSATLWTTDISRMHQAIRTLRVGELAVNACPRPAAGASFGSLPLEGHKQSGFGTESGLQGVLAYSAQTSVQINTARC